MEFAIVLIATLILCIALRTAIRKHAVAFYVMALGVDVLFVAGSTLGLPRELWSILFVLVQKCELSLALFTMVMYVGALSKTTVLYQWLKPIRAELSIIAWLLALGHMAVYLASYGPRLASGGSLNAHVVGGFAFALVLLVLLMVLGVTSFHFVKRHMRTETWKRVQKLAYPFFMLVYVHVLMLLMPAAMRGGAAAVVTVGVYSLVFLGYAVLRLRRAWIDREGGLRRRDAAVGLELDPEAAGAR